MNNYYYHGSLDYGSVQSDPARPLPPSQPPTAIQVTDQKILEVDCNHTWIDIGFRFTRIVCKHCNQEMGT